MLPQEEGSTRSKLLQLLKTQGQSGIGDLSRALGITEMAVRRHVHTLERDGLIKSSLVRQAMGRPLYRYSLTLQADDLFPKNYPQLTLDLLSELEEQSGPEIIDRMFQGRMAKLEVKYGERMQGKPLEDRVAELTHIQNAAGYMTEWERPDAQATYLMHEYNCPIAQIASQYRQACHCERQLFEKLLDAEVERTECLADGGSRCTYAIRPNSE